MGAFQRRLATLIAATFFCLSFGTFDSVYGQNARSKPAAAPAGAGDVDKAIRQGAAAFVDAFNRGDAKALAAMWTDDGDYVDESGDRSAGREAIEKKYANFFSSEGGAKIEITVDAVRQLGADAVIEDGRSKVVLASQAAPVEGRYTVVHVRRDGGWKMASVRDFPINASTSADPLQDVAWLVGAWHAEHRGAEIEVNCRWLANNSFVEATFARREGEKLTPTATQIIGVNPLSGRITSWMFNGDGGVATGDWLPRDAGWIIGFQGATADGVPTTAVNMLFRVHDALVWKSLNRTAAGQPLPDVAEVVLKRK